MLGVEGRHARTLEGHAWQHRHTTATRRTLLLLRLLLRELQLLRLLLLLLLTRGGEVLLLWLLESSNARHGCWRHHTYSMAAKATATCYTELG